MKTAIRIYVEVKYVICPHCGMAQDGWVDDPRKVNEVQDCFDCRESFKIARDAELVIE